MKIHIYEEESSLLKLYKQALSVKGHQVQGFTSHYVCPYVDQSVDAVIVDIRLLSPGLEPLRYQARKDCQCHRVRVAVIGTAFTDEQKECIERLGHISLKKPFKLSVLNDWVDSCVA